MSDKVKELYFANPSLNKFGMRSQDSGEDVQC